MPRIVVCHGCRLVAPLVPGQAVWALLLLVVAAAACGRAAETPGPAPALSFLDRDQIETQRTRKDEDYRLSEDSPIPPEQRESFTGLEYYDFDPELRFIVHLERYDEPKPFTIISTQGKERPAVKLGYLSFSYGGQDNRLEVYSLRDLSAEHWDALFLPFKDATTGSETYGAGRYVELAKGVDDWYLLDFNTAYNPLCAYGRTVYRCPSTPAENRLKVAIRAGERGFSHAAEPRSEVEPAPEAGGQS